MHVYTSIEFKEITLTNTDVCTEMDDEESVANWTQCMVF